MNDVDSVVDRSEFSGLATKSLHEDSTYAEGNPLGVGSFVIEEESVLLDGPFNEEGLSKKKVDIGGRQGWVKIVVWEATSLAD